MFLSYVYRLVNLLVDSNDKVRDGYTEENWTDVGVTLTACLSRVSLSFGLSSVTNHQYVRLISFILLHHQFHHTGKN